ncbi:MAG: hypothetical protein ACRDQU_17000 [Pseudonocardiaceae bacterium]
MNDPRTEGVRGSDESVATTGRPAHDIPDTRHSDIPTQLRRRRAAACRCPPLPDGRRDPLDSADEPITDDEIDTWRATWLHLHRLDLPAVVPAHVLAAGRARRRTGRCGHGDAA